jgi:hypothetical protein
MSRYTFTLKMNVLLMKNILFVTSIFMLGACTITKRVHNPGWHVEWKNKTTIEKGNSIREEVFSAELDTVTDHANPGYQETVARAEPITIERSAISPVDDRSNNTDEVLPPDEIEHVNALEKNSQPALSKNPDRSLEDELTGDERELNPHVSHALTTTLLSLLCLLLLLLGFSGFFSFLCWVGIIITGALTITYAKKGLKEMKEHPDVWRGLKLAKFLFIFGIIEVSAMVIYILTALVSWWNGVIDSLKDIFPL